MIDVGMWVAVLTVSIIILIKSADFFTAQAEKIGLHFGLRPFVVGVTIVAIGTSLPELVSSFLSIFKGASEIVVGNAVGSNIANIFLVLGFAALFARKCRFKQKHLLMDMNVLLGSTLLLVFFLWDRTFTLFEASICSLGLIAYIIYTLQDKEQNKSKKKNVSVSWKTYTILAISAIGIYFGAEYTVTSVIAISDILLISKATVAASVIALGTSLPELAVSIIAARKGDLDVAVGNILGSNVFNILGVVGLSGLVGSLIVTQQMVSFLLPVLLLATIIFVVVCYDRKLKKWEGVVLLVFYGYFLCKLFMV